MDSTHVALPPTTPTRRRDHETPSTINHLQGWIRRCMREIKRLTEENTRLKRLTEENRRLADENRRLADENRRHELRASFRGAELIGNTAASAVEVRVEELMRSVDVR